MNSKSPNEAEGAAARPDAAPLQTPPMPMAVDGGVQPPAPAAAVPANAGNAGGVPPTPDSLPTATPSAEGAGPIRIRLFGRTDVGRIREHNEDNFLVADLSQNARGLMENIRTHTVGAHGTLFAVCDGMGGAAAGEVASKLAVDIIYEQMQAGGPPRHREELARRLVRAVEVAGLRIFAEAKLDRNRRGMGTTATAAALMDDYLFLAQVGDSRGYLLRGDRLELVTRDQSLVNQLIEAGQLTEEEAENFEHSNIILQALGTADSVQVDLTVVKLRHGDTLLLCSDGLSGMVRAEELRQALLAHPEPIDVCKVLTDKANEAGGHDNITVIVAKFEGGPPPAPDEVAKYTKYVFTTESDGAYPPAADVGTSVRPPSGSPPPQPEAHESAHPTPSAGVNAKLGATQLGMNSEELMRQVQQKIDESRGAASPAAGGPGVAAAPNAHSAGSAPPMHGSTESDLRAAGLPSSGMSPWIWIAALLALGLVGVGLYALLGGHLTK
jgi:serine/threonine protein phosphatase PrpC